MKIRRGKSAVLTSFLMISLMELGDKTQFSIMALAAKYSAPALVFLGAVLAYVLLMGVGVLVGSRLIRVVSPRTLRIFTGALFIFLGTMFALSAAGINII